MHRCHEVAMAAAQRPGPARAPKTFGRVHDSVGSQSSSQSLVSCRAAWRQRGANVEDESRGRCMTPIVQEACKDFQSLSPATAGPQGAQPPAVDAAAALQGAHHPAAGMQLLLLHAVASHILHSRCAHPSARRRQSPLLRCLLPSCWKLHG